MNNAARPGYFLPILGCLFLLFAGYAPAAEVAAPVTGTVVDMDTGEPIGGAEVMLLSWSTEADDQGRFTFDNIGFFGPVAIAAVHPDYWVGSSQVTLDKDQAAETRIELEPKKKKTQVVDKSELSGVVSGIVIDAETGQPLPEVVVIIIDEGADGVEIAYGIREVTAQTDQQGRFKITGLRPGKLDVTAFHTYKPYTRYETAETLSANKLTELQIELTPMNVESKRPVGGRVFDKLTKEPIAGALFFFDSLQVGASNAQGGFVKIIPAKDLTEIQLLITKTGYRDLAQTIELAQHTPNETSFWLDPYTHGTLVGRVMDRETGEGIADAKLVVGEEVRQSSTDGKFHFAEIEAGTLVLTASHSRYFPKEITIELAVLETVEQEMTLEPVVTGTLTGTVIDSETGKPLAGVRVITTSGSVDTDSEGRFTFAEVPAGNIRVEGEKDKYHGGSAETRLPRAGTADLELKLDPITTGSVTGVTLDKATGQLLSGVTISISGQSVTTDGEGRFSFEEVAAGAVNLLAQKAVYIEASANIELARTETAEVRLELNPVTEGAISGIVFDAASGNALAGVRIDVDGVHAESGLDGRFMIESVRMGTHRLNASKVIFEAASRDIEISAAQTTELELSLEPITYGALKGVVRDKATSVPLAGVTVKAGSKSTISATDGSFEFQKLSAGNISLSAGAPTYVSDTAELKLEPATTLEHELLLEPITEGRVCGVVTDKVTGKKIAGVRVTMAGQSVETDAQGDYCFDSLPIGKLMAGGRHSDYADVSVAGEVLAGDQIQLNLQMDLRREDVTGLETALDENGTVDLYGILFDPGKSQFRNTSLPTLSAVLTVMERAKSQRFLIIGHTDSDGSDASNQTLSEARAQTVISWLVDNGIAPGRLQGNGLGESQPTAPNDTVSGKALNRRVELKVIN